MVAGMERREIRDRPNTLRFKAIHSNKERDLQGALCARVQEQCRVPVRVFWSRTRVHSAP